MSNVNEREAGFYLARLYEHSKLQVVYVYGGYGAGMIEITGNPDVYTADKFHWIADEPLDLESIRLLMMNGGLENAVEVVHKDSMYNIVS